MFELVIFLIGYFGTDKTIKDSSGNPSIFINSSSFAQFLYGIGAYFECEHDHDSTWWIEASPYSMTLYKLHFIVIFMYTMIFQIVLFIIPYKYDRLEKTPAEEKADKKRRAKARKKKQHRNKN